MRIYNNYLSNTGGFGVATLNSGANTIRNNTIYEDPMLSE